MDEKSQLVAETEAYLAKIRKTVRASRSLVETAKLRIAETDRLLERQGLTREQLEQMKITPEQQRAAEAELQRMGFDFSDLPSEPVSPTREVSVGAEEAVRPAAAAASANFTAGDGDGSVENRKRKFNVMMQQFRM